MGIQSFTPTSGGLSGQTFIDQVYLTYKVRKWNRAGSPGFYRATSALGKDGFVYFVQSDSSIVQAPLNGIANVTLPFTEIRILATQFDMISLYKVSAKGTDSLTLTANYTTITSSGLYTFPTNAVGFCDALIVGGGAAAQHHSGGAGAGGIIEAISIPLPVGSTQSVTIGAGAASSSMSDGGTTTFLGHNARGGGGIQDNGAGRAGAGGGGGAVASAQAGTFNGGTGDGGLAQLNTDKSQSTWLATLGTSLTVPLSQQSASILFTGGSHNGGSANGTGHSGGGGGGAAGPGGNFTNGAPAVGGAGLALNWDGTGIKYYSAGGSASRHSTQTDAANSTNWTQSGHGMGGRSYWNSQTGTNGTNGIVIVRTWSV